MANNLTDNGEWLLLTWQLTANTVTRPTSWWASLHNLTPTEATPSTGEISFTGNNYSRQSVTFLTGTSAATGGNFANNSNALTFGAALVSWSTITDLGIWANNTSQATANSLWTGQLSSSKTVGAGDSLTVAIGALSLQID